MPDISAALKVLLENRLVPSILGLVSGALIYTITSEENSMLIKLGGLGYGLVWAGIIFLAVTFIQYLTAKIKYWIAKYKEYVEDKEYDENQHKEALEELWRFMDRMSAENIEFIREFTKNGNEVIEKPIDFIPGYMQEYFNCKPIIILRQVERGENIIMQYKLDDAFYELLVYSLRIYKKINHFE